MKNIYEISKELLEQVKKTIDAFQKEAHAQYAYEKEYAEEYKNDKNRSSL